MAKNFDRKEETVREREPGDITWFRGVVRCLTAALMTGVFTHFAAKLGFPVEIRAALVVVAFVVGIATAVGFTLILERAMDEAYGTPDNPAY